MSRGLRRPGDKDLVFRFVKVHDSADPSRLEDRLSCDRGAEAGVFVRAVSAQQANPQFIKRLFMEIGWTVDIYKQQNVHCPACMLRRRQKKQAPNEKAVHPVLRLVEKTEPAPVAQTAKEAQMTTPTPLHAAKAAAPAVPRQPTPAERAKIRDVLEIQFDGLKGMYYDGYSDQKVGEVCSVPWAIVSQIREAAYGPIRQDPEIARLESDLEMIKKQLVEAQKQVSAAQAIVQSAEAAQARLQAKLSELGKRLGL